MNSTIHQNTMTRLSYQKRNQVNSERFICKSRGGTPSAIPLFVSNELTESETKMTQTTKMTNLEINAEIHEFDGRFYIAKWSDKNAQWTGSLRADIARGSGCSGFFCRREKGLPGAGGYSYTTKSAARRAVIKLNDW